eukprot:3814797-Rhodomonas_salina.2
MLFHRQALEAPLLDPTVHPRQVLRPISLAYAPTHESLMFLAYAPTTNVYHPSRVGYADNRITQDYYATLRAAPQSFNRHVRHVRAPILSAYAMSGTEIACLAICLRGCYAKSGTEIACGQRGT